MNVNINNKEEDMKIRDEDKSDESKNLKKFDAMLKDIKSIGRTNKPISVKCHSSNINHYPLIIRLLNTGKTVRKKDYGFVKVFVIFDDTDITCHELNEFNPRTINRC